MHVKPLGSGTTSAPAPGGVDAGRCNDKLIGATTSCARRGQCLQQSGFREEPGFGDTNSHGSHVARRSPAIAAWSRSRRAGVDLGVARVPASWPRHCYTNISTGQGLCPNVSAVAAIDQIVIDGVADVINYSIGGGAQPWGEAVSLAFLNVVEAGVFVAASAGNSGPAAGTLGHVEPWVSSTAAARHGREGFSFLMQVTGPGTVPEPLTAIELSTGANGVGHTVAYPASTPLRVSPTVDAVDDGCAGYPAGTFNGAIAVVRRGGCSFTIKTNAASAAGAVAVVIANNLPEVLVPSVPDTTVPAFGVPQAVGNALRDFNAANPAATATIGFPAAPLPNTADALAASARAAGRHLQPDQARRHCTRLRHPGAVSGTTISGSENAGA